MGNKTSSGVSLNILLDNGNAPQIAGNTLTGKVIVSVSKSVPGGEEVSLMMDGMEKVAISVNFGHATGETWRKERVFFTARPTLRSFPEDTLHPGKYECPFSIPLPTAIPSTTSYPTGVGTLGDLGYRVQYMIRAQFRGVKKEMYVDVQSAPLSFASVPCMIEPTSFPVHGMFSKRGTVTIGASVEDTAIGKGETLELHLACHNDSTAEIERVQITIYEEREWKIDEHRRRHSSEAIVTLHDVRLPDLDKRPKGKLEVWRSKNRQDDIYRLIHSALVSGRNKLSLKIPESARDSYTGHLIRVWHLIEIKIQTAMMASNPSKTIPLRIGTPPAAQHSATPMRAAVPLPGRLPRRDQVVVTETDKTPENIPIISAVAVMPKETEQTFSSADATKDSVIQLGEDAIILDASELSNMVPVAPPNTLTLDVSVTGLLRVMGSSIHDFDLIEERLRYPQWVELFRSISTDEFGNIIAQVNIDFDQTRVATLLAPHVNGGDGFTCQYAAAAVRSASEWNRSNMAQRLVPLCVDIATEHNVVRRELNEWEQTVTGRDFEDAIAAAR